MVTTYDTWKTTDDRCSDDRDARHYHCHRCGAFVLEGDPDYNPRREECGPCAERRLSIIDDALDNRTDDRGGEDDVTF